MEAAVLAGAMFALACIPWAIRYDRMLREAQQKTAPPNEEQ